MVVKSVLLVGGAGFIGTHVAQALVAKGIQAVVPTRRRDHAKHLLPLPTVEVVETDILEGETLYRLMRGVDAVVNLIGVLHSRSGGTYGKDFDLAHVQIPRAVVKAAEQAGVQRLVHISALGASSDGPSHYLRSKAAGEVEVRSSRLEWAILQPSVVFGPGDSFLNLFARLVANLPVLPLAGASTRFQPVFVEDVVEVVLRSLTDPTACDQTFPLCGPRVYTLEELVRLVGQITGHSPLIVGIPEGLGYLQAMVFEMLPGEPLMSRDNLRSMRKDNICGPDALFPFGIVPTALEVVAPLYLGRESPRARYTDFRERARR